MAVPRVHYIVEGENGVGKSTFIRALIARDPDLIYHHFVFPKGETIDEKYGYQRGQFEMLFQFLSMTNDRFVLDRSHIGEYVWGPKLRDRFPTYLPALEHQHRNVPIVIVHITTDPNEIINRFLVHRKDEVPPELSDIEWVQSEFGVYCRRSPFPHITIHNEDVGNGEQLVKLMDTRVEKVIELASCDLNPPSQNRRIK